ncbi:sulfite exporter TauE/SafE family protein [Rhodocaloribacter litoris]|uniref:sulfite exporter TauE/SafE family protein n=1 Tax=Rhodocaloribacter litoris TaxID=2558931 RepID=UPI00141ECB40|nr:sulfite exporter TauE/SafE family protein [Rhodocaloribacter litoris]QXD15197.1 sulfite exporter TauE/SafE family protein [Rhodocaloribacter litoris]GIV60439.1 MAG: UPF0721 transmembrane protein [Rhodothermaceae bacterium]
MATGTLLLLVGLVTAIALLYASVGHGGASGYLAVMALLDVAPAEMRPAALALNILVAAIGTAKFYRRGYFSWRLFWPFALLSMPMAYVGGRLVLPDVVYRPVVGAVLVWAAYRLYRQTGRRARSGTSCDESTRPFILSVALAAGAGLGLLSGLTGVGGGIFLSPLLLLAGWADARATSAVAAAFILVNSVAGLLGHLAQYPALPAFLPWLAVGALAGGWAGAELGSRRFSGTGIRRVLALILLGAGVKMILAMA